MPELPDWRQALIGRTIESVEGNSGGRTLRLRFTDGGTLQAHAYENELKPWLLLSLEEARLSLSNRDTGDETETSKEGEVAA